MVTARGPDPLREEEKPQGQLPVPPGPSMPAHSSHPQGWGPHWANPAPCSMATPRDHPKTCRQGYAKETWQRLSTRQMLTGTAAGISKTLGWTGAEGVRGWLLLSPVGWGLFPKAPFQWLQPAGRRLELPTAVRVCQDYQGAPGGSLEVTAGRAPGAFVKKLLVELPTCPAMGA